MYINFLKTALVSFITEIQPIIILISRPKINVFIIIYTKCFDFLYILFYFVWANFVWANHSVQQFYNYYI